MTTPYYSSEDVTLHLGDCLDVLPTLPDASVDAICTDPPYELAFMGRQWDASGIAFNPAVWAECLRVLKPGGHLLAFGGTRTYHRLAVATEDAGFEIRDSIHWMFGSGFPKSLDVSKAIDRQRNDRADIVRVASWLADQAAGHGITKKDVDAHMGTSDMGGWWLSKLPHRAAVPTWEQWQRLRTFIGCGDEMDAEVWRLNGRKGTPGEAWAEREVIGQRTTGIGTGRGSVAVIGDSDNRDLTTAATVEARHWQGWGTALKPAHEPIVLARKPLTQTVAGNVLEHGTGALNIDGCRTTAGQDYRDKCASVVGLDSNRNGDAYGAWTGARADSAHQAGRWPTNVVWSHLPECGPDDSTPCQPGCAVAELDRQSGTTRSSGGVRGGHIGANGVFGEFEHNGPRANAGGLGDEGGASRFFPVFRYEAKAPASERPRLADGTAHTTVKPLALMRWLVRLVTPPGGLVLDPFAGSGTTGEACVIEGFRTVLIEREVPHAELIKARLAKPIAPVLDLGEAL